MTQALSLFNLKLSLTEPRSRIFSRELMGIVESLHHLQSVVDDRELSICITHIPLTFKSRSFSATGIPCQHSEIH